MRAWILTVLSLLLTACVSFQPSAEKRGVEFPLVACAPENIARAAVRLSSPTPLKFDGDWVCVTPPPPAASSSSHVERSVETAVQPVARSAPQDESLRAAIEAPFVDLGGHSRPMLGIALAGGGSKAGAFGTGVLAGMSDVGLLDTAAYLSSVSGGSYASYFYYVHRVFPLVKGDGRPRPTTENLFWDCVRKLEPHDSPEISAKIVSYGGCSGNELSLLPGADTPLDNRYQAFLRCQQDVFEPGRCTIAPANANPLKTIDPLTVLGSVTLFPLGLIANTIFDWGVSVSPSAHTYSDGIGVGYGTTVGDPASLATAFTANDRIDCETRTAERHAFDCKTDSWGRTRPVPMSFDELREGMIRIRSEAGGHVPFWIINATAQRYRSAVGWVSLGNQETGNDDLFEMTAVSHGADKWGYVSAPASLHDMSVLDAVAASAAFLDSTELAVTNKAAKGVIGFGLRFGNLDWGADIPNYNVTDARRTFHMALPIPLYWTDSGIDRAIGPAHRHPEMVDRQHTAFIRLIDGGNGEDLGVYPLLKRNVQTIVVADSASDGKGLFEDFCSLQRRLNPGKGVHPRYLLIPGLKDFRGHCDRLKDGDRRGYPIHHWRFGVPMLMGCVRAQDVAEGKESCTGLSGDDTRLLIVKPAIDVEAFLDQTHTRTSAGKKIRVIDNCLLPNATPDAESANPLNCDTSSFLLRQWRPDKNGCPKFPQDGTATMTLSSSSELFVAYRELGRQYVRQSKGMLSALASGDDQAFERVANNQGSNQVQESKPESEEERRQVKCPDL